MPYVTSAERLGFHLGFQLGLQLGLEKGERRGWRRCIMVVLETRFTALPASIREQVEEIDDTQRLRQLHRRAAVVESLERFADELLAGS